MKEITLFNKYIQERFGIIIDSKNRSIANHFINEHKDLFASKEVKTELDKMNLQDLVNKLTVNESYFFRDDNQIGFIRDLLLKHSEKSSAAIKNINIWSMGCSSGEEAYTIAIILDELGFLNNNYWRINIQGFDINSEIIKKARSGIYSNWSFRGVKEDYIEKYFNKIDDNKYQISPQIMKYVKFNLFNITQDIFEPSISDKFGSPDIILCRNILMYFKQETITPIVDRMAQLMTKDGCIIPGIQEVRLFTSSHLSSRFVNNTFVFYKNVENIETKKEFRTLHSQYVLNKEKSKSEKEKIKKPIKNNKLPIVVLDKADTDKKNKKENKATLLFDDNYKLLLKNAMSLLNEKDYDQAIELCEQAIFNKSHDFIPYYIKSNIFFHLDDIDSAIENIKKALFVNSESPLLHFSYSNFLIRKNNFEKVEKHLKKANKLLLDNADDSLILEIVNMTKEELHDYIKRMLEIVEVKNA